MKTTFSHQLKKGFTLIELLVVIVILGALAGVSYPLITSLMGKGDITTAKKMCNDIVNGSNEYYKDHNDLPLDFDSVSEDSTVVELTTDGENDANLVHILFYTKTGKEVGKGNKAYMAADSVTEPADGLYLDGELAGLYDPWGKPYRVIFNLNTESLIDPFDNRTIQGKWCIAYSTGPDGEGAHHAIEANKAGSTKGKNKDKNKGKNKGKNKNKDKDSESEEELMYPGYSEEENKVIEDNIYSWKTVDN